MQVIRGAKAGFCMGVSLALKKLENAILRLHTENGDAVRICTLGPIIHNQHVFDYFSEQGVVCLEEAGKASENDYVLIRAHGVPREQEELLRSHCHEVEDATCPRVKKAQLAIAQATAEGATLLLFGEFDHPEVQGLISYASNVSLVFDSLAALEKMSLDETQTYVLASQTTQDRESFEKISAYLAQQLKKLRILFTICDATRERQAEARMIASQVELMVVAGGKSSGNTRRLADLARQAGIPVLHVESARELTREAFADVTLAGLIAGASTPGKIIDEIEEKLLAFGSGK